MHKISLICLLATVPFVASASAQTAEGTITCQGADNTTVVLDLWKPAPFDVPIHCLTASFAPEMVACAPQGGWGLGRDAAMTELVDVTNDWNTAHMHEAGKVIASAGKRGVHFTAHVGKGISSNLMYDWKFAYNRRAGRATWYGSDGTRVAYTCEASG